MDFTLDKKHEMARSLFREFAENEVKPLAQEVDAEARLHGHPGTEGVRRTGL